MMQQQHRRSCLVVAAYACIALSLGALLLTALRGAGQNSSYGAAQMGSSGMVAVRTEAVLGSNSTSSCDKVAHAGDGRILGNSTGFVDGTVSTSWLSQCLVKAPGHMLLARLRQEAFCEDAHPLANFGGFL